MPESRRDTGQRRPLPDIGAMQDTGRSPPHLLLDDRASRDGACGSDRRRRARGPARQPRTLRRQEDQGRLGKKIKAALERKGVTASGRRIGGIMHEQGMTSAYTRRRFKPHGILGHGSVSWFPTAVLSFWRMKKSCTGRGPRLSHQRRKPKARKNPDVIATAG